MVKFSFQSVYMYSTFIYEDIVSIGVIGLPLSSLFANTGLHSYDRVVTIIVYVRLAILIILEHSLP